MKGANQSKSKKAKKAKKAPTFKPKKQNKQQNLSTPVLKRSKIDVQVGSTMNQFDCLLNETKPVGEFLNELSDKTAIIGKTKSPSKRFILSLSKDLALCYIEVFVF
jgi:hypothetical protein